MHLHQLCGGLATLRTVHDLAVLLWVMDTKLGELMCRGLRREHLVSRQKQAQGLGAGDLDRIQAASQDGDAARNARDDALLAVAYEAMLREELVALQLEHLTVESDGSDRVLLARRKTDQEEIGSVKYLTPETVVKLQRWIGLAGLEAGPLFRSAPRRASQMEHESAKCPWHRTHPEAAGEGRRSRRYMVNPCSIFNARRKRQKIKYC